LTGALKARPLLWFGC